MKSWNLAVRLPPVWRGGGATLFYITRELYEPELTFLNRLLSPGQTFVDGGANIGLFTLAAASIVGPAGKVLTFEPGVRSLQSLKDNVALNQLAQVEIFGAALSNNDGEALFFGADEQANSATLGAADAGSQSRSQTVRTMRLDSIFQARNYPAVHVLKLDVEGAESLVLQGASEILERHRPIVIFEVNHEAARAFDLPSHAAWDLLAGLKYRFFEFSPTGELLPAQKPNQIRNVVAMS